MDVSSVAYVIGFATASAALAFFVTRKTLGPSGVAEVDRLKRLAGVSEPGDRTRSRLREWIPYVSAIGGFVFGSIFGAGSLKQSGFSAQDQEQLESNFSSGCVQSCVKGERPQGCHNYCGCVLSEFKRRYPTAKGLGDFFHASIEHQPAAMAAYGAVAKRCSDEYMVDTEAVP